MHALSRIRRPALARIQPRFRLRHSLREGPSAFAPTRTDLVANSLRMRIRLFLRGSSEGNWRIDHVAAVLSWLVAGTGAVLLAGTTTVVSLLVMGANSISVQKYLAVKVSEYVSKESGFDISFDHAIMPNWKDGTIRIKNVDIVCNEASNPSPSETYAKRLLHSDASQAANSQQPSSAIQKQLDTSDIDLNWTYFAINVKTMDLTLNLWRYFQGHGIVQDMKLTGVRGVIDRAHVTWTEDWKPVHRKATPFDFALEQVVVEDLLLTVKNPYGFRPFNVSVYSGRLPILRQQWLVYDIMCADSIVGAFDNCLFSVHKWKTQTSSSGGEAGLGAEMSHLKINGLPIDHLNVGVTGPMSWLTNGSIDVDFHFLFPQQPDDQLFSQIRQEFAGFKYIAMDTLEKETKQLVDWYEPRRYPSRYTITGAGQTGEFRVPEKQDVNRPFEAPTILMHFAICLNDLRANVPLTSPQLGYMSHALIRPIVAYMNNHRVRIPLSFEARMELSKFDGSWDFWSAGIVDIVAEEVGRAMTLLVLDERERARHLKRIGLWSVQTTTRNLMEIVDFVRGVTDFPLMGARAPAFA
ncbi:mitochondrial distribution and morphology protein family 31/32 [Chytriomyces cf. hyalinus JEL632]|nr:mitochondrial distribution and morphology protein family 31/32 [Chytriomyces cf. hyalinus JEL632]